MARKRQSKRSRWRWAGLGNPLFEGITTACIVVGLSLVVVPAINSMMKEQHLDTAVLTLNQHLQEARARALQYGEAVTLCHESYASNQHCRSPHRQAQADWSKGWVTGVSSDRKMSGSVQSPNGDITMFADTIDDTRITFSEGGRLVHPQVVGFRICDDRGAKFGRVLTILENGQTRIEKLQESRLLSCHPQQDDANIAINGDGLNADSVL